MLQSVGQPAMSAGMDGLVRGPIAMKLAQMQRQQQQPGRWKTFTRRPISSTEGLMNQEITLPQEVSDEVLVGRLRRSGISEMTPQEALNILASGSA